MYKPEKAKKDQKNTRKSKQAQQRRRKPLRTGLEKETVNPKQNSGLTSHPTFKRGKKSRLERKKGKRTK